MKNFFNKNLFWFRKTHSLQHASFKLLPARQRELDKSGNVGTILMDLLTANDCIPGKLLMAKLEKHGLDKKKKNILFYYLNNRKQRIKTGPSFSF